MCSLPLWQLGRGGSPARCDSDSVLLVPCSAWMPRATSAEGRREESTSAEAGSEPDVEDLVSEKRRRKRAVRDGRREARALAQAYAAR